MKAAARVSTRTEEERGRELTVDVDSWTVLWQVANQSDVR
jgi:hypothetical protein